MLAAAIGNLEGVGSGGMLNFLNLAIVDTHIDTVANGVAQLYFFHPGSSASSGSTYGLYVAYNVDGTTRKHAIEEYSWTSGMT